MACEKKTFSGKHDTAHAWAQQSQHEGREAARVLRIFFEGPTIYSYGRHFPIATFHQKKGGARVVLFTTRGYSNTTAAHIQAARGAISHVRIVYCLRPLKAAAGDHAENMADFEANAKAIALKLAKATKPEIYINQIDAERRRMEDYAGYFKIGIKKFKFKFLYLESKEMASATTKKEIAAAKKAAEALRAKRAAHEKEQAERLALMVEADKASFHNFERDTVRIGEFTFLRFQPNEREIKTSKGVRISYNDAYRHYDRLKSLQFRYNRQGYLSTNDQGGGEFEGYRLRNITADYFEIGCHKIEWAELDYVAKAARFPAWKVEGVEV